MAMIRNLLALALLALVAAPLVSLHNLGSLEAPASVRFSKIGPARVVSFDALLAATRL
jgi:hypothetical protein